MEIKIIPALKQFSEVSAGFSTRIGGFSEGSFKGLNLGYSTADDPSSILKNQKLVQKYFNWNKAPLWLRQTHSSKLVKADPTWKSPPEADALYTKEKFPLQVFSADCLPILFFMRDIKIVGAIHAGWRGTVSKILYKTCNYLKQKYQSLPRQTFISLGPCISQKNYEVSKKIALQFPKESVLKNGDRFYVDIKAANLLQATDFGIPEGNIESIPYCNFEWSDLFYSYRRDGGYTGRYAGLISLA